MREPYFWYVLYTASNAERRVMKDIAEAYSKRGLDYDFEPFFPESEVYYRKSDSRMLGKVYKKRPLFPSYVFLETEMPQKEFLKEFSSYIYESPDIIRILRYGASGSIAISDSDRMRFEYLFKGKRCLEHSVGYIEGDKVVVTAGPLIGHEGQITYINRHNQSATIKFEMFGRTLETKVALEIVDKR